MYIIKKNNKRTSRKVFETYEKARQYARKLIRNRNFIDVFDTNWIHHRTPTISYYGYSIQKVS